MTLVPDFDLFCPTIVAVRPMHFDGQHILAVRSRSPSRNGSQPSLSSVKDYEAQAAELSGLPETGTSLQVGSRRRQPGINAPVASSTECLAMSQPWPGARFGCPWLPQGLPDRQNAPATLKTGLQPSGGSGRLTSRTVLRRCLHIPLARVRDRFCACPLYRLQAIGLIIGRARGFVGMTDDLPSRLRHLDALAIA
jgi:hypothetical protein